MRPVPVSSPGASTARHRAAIDAAIARVLDSGRYVLDAEVAAFERELASFLGGSVDVAGVSNGTDAITLALTAAGVGAGDEVIVPALTAVATAAGVVACGATPVFADVEPSTLTLDVKSAAAAIGAKTRAIVVVHLYGCVAAVADLVELAHRYGLVLVEDCAQALGAALDGKLAGTFGDVAAFSFYPTKNLGALGDGGAVAARDRSLVSRVRRARSYGWDEQRLSQEPGRNCRLDEIQAAVLRVKLPHVVTENDRRRTIAARYQTALAGSEKVVTPSSTPGHVWHLYVVRAHERAVMRAQLLGDGVATAVHYDPPLHIHPAYASSAPRVPLDVAERAAREVMSIPVWPELDDADVEAVAQALVRRASR